MGSNSEQVIGRAKAHLLQNYRTQPVVLDEGLAILAKALAG